MVSASQTSRKSYQKVRLKYDSPQFNVWNTIMGLLLWIIFGALVGWIASKIMGTDAQQGGLANIIIGIVGAMLGGWIMSAVGGHGISGFNVPSFLVALLGAVVLIAIVKAIRK